MRHALVVALALVAPAFAGCLGADDGPVQDPAPTGPVVAPTPGVQRFRGDGTLLDGPAPLEAPLAVARYALTGFAGAEPNLGITSSGTLFATADDLVIRSVDAGRSWEEVYDWSLQGAPVDPLINADPMLWVDPATDMIYNLPMFPPLACGNPIISADDGATWAPAGPNCGRGVYDHQKIGGGPPGPGAPAVAGTLHPTVLYICYNALITTNCAVSYDNGATWPHDVPVWTFADDYQGPNEPNCAGQNGNPQVGPDGTVVVPKSWFCAGLYVAVSTDSGLTWTVREGPKIGGDTLTPEVGFTPDGTLYAFWQGSDHLSYLARSGDAGVTWAGPWKVSPPEVTSTVFATLTAGDDGRVAVAFLGTRDTDEHPSDAPDEARWALYIVTTDDGHADDPAFTSYQVTPDDDPVQIGCVWIGGGGTPCRNMLDFIDSAVAPDGTYYVVYTEGCAAECSSDEDADANDSRDDEIAIAALDGFLLGSPVAPAAIDETPGRSVVHERVSGAQNQGPLNSEAFK